MRRHKVFSIGLAVVGVLFLGTRAALAVVDDCPTVGGIGGGGTPCLVSGTHDVALAVLNFPEDVVLQPGAVINGTNLAGLTITISPGDLTMDFGSAITCNDDLSGGASGDSARPITINVSGKLLMQSDSKIQAEDQNDGGDGGKITITVGGDMTMCGPAGAQPGCGGAVLNSAGALISSRKLGGAGDTGVGGDIAITVGNASTATGKFYMEGGSTAYGAETGAKILSSGTGQAGDIRITVGRTYFTEPGSVVEAGGPFAGQTTIAQGGQIYIVSDCELTSQGRVTSKGRDPGADLVHLESCTVLIEGLVESTGPGHTAGVPNSCDSINDGLTGEIVRSGKPANASGCVEVWGNTITIDSTNGWAGELNADIGDGGTGGTSWIDIFAKSNLTVTDGTGNDRISDNGGPTYFSTYAVHANTMDGSDNTPSVVTALVSTGPLTASGKAFEASATLTGATGHNPGPFFVGNGSDGGTIDLEASGNVTLDTAWVNASGDFDGTSGDGGHIIVSAWGVGSNLSWKDGDGNVQPNDTGDIGLNACPPGTITTTGTEFHGEVPTPSSNCDPAKPAIPPTIGATCSLCVPPQLGLKSGIKFNDLNGNGIKDPGELGLNTWVIHLFGTMDAGGTRHETFTTHTAVAGDEGCTVGEPGCYFFGALAPGTYHVCEQLKTNWTQTFPTMTTTPPQIPPPGEQIFDCTGPPPDPFSDNPTPGKWGYTFTITAAGEHRTGNNFGNRIICTEDPTAVLTRSVSNPFSRVPNYATLQAAYDAAGNGETIGMFGNTSENVVLGGAKTLKITQCTSARITAATAGPVWTISSTGKLTIVGPDAVGGTIGWLLQTGGHTLKSVRSNGASQYGILISSNSNSVSWNDVSGNGPGAGIRVTGGSNTLKGGTVGPNNGDGVQLLGNSNNLSGSNILSNTGNGVLVAGSTNTVTSNGRVNQNGKNGILVTGPGSSNTISSNQSESGKGNTLMGIRLDPGANNNQLTDNKMFSDAKGGFSISGIGNKLKSNNGSNNTSFQLDIVKGNTDQTGNKANGANCTFTSSLPKTCF